MDIIANGLVVKNYRARTAIPLLQKSKSTSILRFNLAMIDSRCLAAFAVYAGLTGLFPAIGTQAMQATSCVLPEINIIRYREDYRAFC